MALRKGSKVERGYATITDDDGVEYREISEVMTEMGWPMNHSSARNYVLRGMKKFAIAFKDHLELEGEASIDDIARSPRFQSFVSEVLQRLEAERRSTT